MTVEEREMILNLSYEELIEKFKNELQKVIKFLQDEQKKKILTMIQNISLKN